MQRYIILERRISGRLKRCEELRAQLGKVTATYSLQPGGGGSIHKSRDHDIINTIADHILQMEQEVELWEAAGLEVRDLLAGVREPVERELLEYRYLYGHRFEQIAANMNYGFRHTLRLHGQALSNLEINEEALV